MVEWTGLPHDFWFYAFWWLVVFNVIVITGNSDQ